MAHGKNNFDFIRLAAATSVLISHMFALMGRNEPMVAGNHSLGNIGLLIFFSVSGYLVAISWTRDPALFRFALRRFLRIWPALAIVLLICAFAIAPIFSQPPHHYSPISRGTIVYLTNLVPLHPYRELNVFAGQPYAELNGSLWTIPIEIWCYIFLGLAGFALRSRLSFAIPVAMALVCAYFVFVYGGEARIDSANGKFGMLFLSVYLGSFFLMGSFLHLFEKSVVDNPIVCAIVIAASAVLLFFGQYMLGLWLGLPLLVILIGRSSWPVARDAGRFGDFSYGIYLYAWPVQQIIVRLLGVHRPLPLMCAAALAIVLVMAFFSWRLIEKRALRMKPKEQAAMPA
jgi:peptidoglycan/LPS O-acetylase OafA/YrhL